ncbi:MAG: hypothetical protein OXN25_01565 [Candidatus Poribacteria bacterium]|nr:hypothetical protein [Candidatus Poribacteria bacterium]
MGYFYESKELRSTYETQEKVMQIVRAYLPSLQDYQKLGHSQAEAKQHKEAKFNQDTDLLVTLGAALRDCLRVHIDKAVLASFIDDIINGNIENIEDTLTTLEDSQNADC